MPLSNPLPSGLAGECRQASQIFRGFVDPTNGMDKLIPTEVLRQAKGFAILTVVKAGFVFSARAGTGLVIARLPDGSWSAPSAIGTAGAGFGGQVGAELTEFIIVLNSKSAVKSFMSAGSVTLGGNLSVAVGPLGRNAEGTGALNTKGKVAAMYSYSKTKGLFGGVSIEGSVIVERSDANSKAYGSDVSVKQLLSGSVEVPAFADALIDTISQRAGAGEDATWIDDTSEGRRSRGYSFSSPYASVGSDTPRSSKGYDEFDSAFASHNERSGDRKSRKGKDRSRDVDERDPFADSRSSPTWRRNKDAGSDDDQPRQSIDTINGDRDRYEEEDRIWRPPDMPKASPKLKKGGFMNRSRASSRASATGFNPHFDSSLDDDAPQRQFTPPPSKSRLSPFGNRSRAGSRASDFNVPPELHARASPDLGSSPVSTRVGAQFATGSATSQRKHRKGDSLDVAYDSSMQSDDIVGHGGVADSLRAHRRGSGTLIDLSDEERKGSRGHQAKKSSGSSSNGFKFGDTTARMANVNLADPRPKFLSTDTRTASFDAGLGQAIATYDFEGQEEGDLSFKRNDVITIVKRIPGEEWWSGRIGMREGIFPLNRVEIVNS